MSSDILAYIFTPFLLTTYMFAFPTKSSQGLDSYFLHLHFFLGKLHYNSTQDGTLQYIDLVLNGDERSSSSSIVIFISLRDPSSAVRLPSSSFPSATIQFVTTSRAAILVLFSSDSFVTHQTSCAERPDKQSAKRFSDHLGLHHCLVVGQYHYPLYEGLEPRQKEVFRLLGDL